MDSNSRASLRGLKVVSFESRRSDQMAELIRRYGGEAVLAPSMREVPIGETAAAAEFMRQLEAGKLDFVVFLTGVGARSLVETVASHCPMERLKKLLQKPKLVVRGSKPAAVLGGLGLRPDIVVPEPNTWRDILTELDRHAVIKGRRVAVQEYGVTNKEFIAGLEARGAEVFRVPVYRWALPENTEPLRLAIREIAAGHVDIALFTNATQVDHLFKMAIEERLDEKLREALQRILVASIGPVCSEALEQLGLQADIEPEHPKMGHLMAAVAECAQRLLGAKRDSRP